jgi:potassium-transporting ATPase ATP-binding subunit
MATSTTSKVRSVQHQHGGHAPSERVQGGLLDPAMLVKALPDAMRKFDPRTLWRNPVMLIVEIGAVWSTILTVQDSSWFGWLVVFWLWLTVLFGNLAESVAEGRGKAQADTLRKSKADTIARRLRGWTPEKSGTEEDVRAPELQKGDIVVVEAGEIIPGDGEIVDGIASVNESAITGESAPVIRESGGDRSAVTGGTTVLSDRIIIKITQEPGKSFIDRMIALVEGANRQKTPNEIALNILLAALTLIFLFAVATLQPLAIYSKVNNPGVADTLALTKNGVSGVVLVALLVCLIPTTIGALLSATRCCWTRPEQSRWATGRRPTSSRSRVSPPRISPTPRSCPALPTKPPKDAPSWCMPSRRTDCASAPPANSPTHSGWSSPPPPGCRARTWMADNCARARPAR